MARTVRKVCCGVQRNRRYCRKFLLRRQTHKNKQGSAKEYIREVYKDVQNVASLNFSEIINVKYAVDLTPSLIRRFLSSYQVERYDSWFYLQTPRRPSQRMEESYKRQGSV